MDKRPPQRSRLWSGGAYDSDTEDPDSLKSEGKDVTANFQMKVGPSTAQYIFLGTKLLRVVDTVTSHAHSLLMLCNIPC
jgi:hypothetical protein